MKMDYITIEKNKNTAVYIREPLFIGDFSLDSLRSFHHDKRNLKFIDADFSETKKVYFDLNKALEKKKRRDFEKSENEKLNNLLNWIKMNKYKFYTDETKNSHLTSLSTDFVCFRGLLTRILCVPYEFRDALMIHATKFNGTIYMCEINTPEKRQRELSKTEREIAMSSWGYKFEQYMTNEDPSIGVDESEEYCCVVRTRLGPHSLVYGAEVDGADKKLYHTPHRNLKAFIELKTCKELVTNRDWNNFLRYRLPKWWAQSYLVGIPRLICGFRDDRGIINSLKSYEIQEIPEMAKDYWDINVMFNFLNEFLSWIKVIIKEDNPAIIYEIRRDCRSDSIYCKCLGVKRDLQIISPDIFD